MKQLSSAEILPRNVGVAGDLPTIEACKLQKQGSDKPNIVLIHAHDFGRMAGIYGTGLATPSIDSIGRDGICCGRAFATAPICTPSRASMITGRYPHCVGIEGLVTRTQLQPDERTLPRVLAKAGYHTALLGVQHERLDADLGYVERRNLTEVPGHYSDHVLAQAREFLVGRRGTTEPFYVSVGFFEPHRAWPEKLYPRTGMDSLEMPAWLPDLPGIRRDYAGFVAAVERLDLAVGELLRMFRAEEGLAERTVFVFTTDHGVPFPRAKSTLYDLGIEVALMACGPGIARREVADDSLISLVDLFPTVLDIAGITVPQDLDGTSFFPLLVGDRAWQQQSKIFAEKTYHAEYDPIRAVRTSQFKYIRNFVSRMGYERCWDKQVEDYSKALADDMAVCRASEELYDLDADPLERNNLIGDPAFREIREGLREELEVWMVNTNDPLAACRT